MVGGEGARRIAESRIFYRIVTPDPPTLADFISSAALGRHPRRSAPDAERLWDGLSVFDMAAGAREQARVFPNLGRFIAAFTVVPGSGVRYERTTRTPGHHTVWGDPHSLLASVRGVVPLQVHRGWRDGE